MSDSRKPTAATFLVLGVVWLILSVYEFYTIPSTSEYSLSNHRFVMASIALLSAIASLAAFFWNVRKNQH